MQQAENEKRALTHFRICLSKALQAVRVFHLNKCGVVWYGVVWRGVVWCGVAWYGVVWYRTSRVN